MAKHHRDLVLPLHGFALVRGHGLIVMGLATARTLDDLAGQLSEDSCRYVFAWGSKFISAMHDLGFVHRDVKPANIGIDVDGRLRGLDFGAAAELDPKGLAYGKVVGTEGFMAPERDCPRRAAKEGYGKMADFFSLAVTVAKLRDDSPWSDAGEEVLRAMTEANVKRRAANGFAAAARWVEGSSYPAVGPVVMPTRHLEPPASLVDLIRETELALPLPEAEAEAEAEAEVEAEEEAEAEALREEGSGRLVKGVTAE